LLSAIPVNFRNVLAVRHAPYHDRGPDKPHAQDRDDPCGRIRITHLLDDGDDQDRNHGNESNKESAHPAHLPSASSLSAIIFNRIRWFATTRTATFSAP